MLLNHSDRSDSFLSDDLHDPAVDGELVREITVDTDEHIPPDRVAVFA